MAGGAAARCEDGAMSDLSRERPRDGAVLPALRPPRPRERRPVDRRGHRHRRAALRGDVRRRLAVAANDRDRTAGRIRATGNLDPPRRAGGVAPIVFWPMTPTLAAAAFFTPATIYCIIAVLVLGL